MITKEQIEQAAEKRHDERYMLFTTDNPNNDRYYFIEGFKNGANYIIEYLQPSTQERSFTVKDGWRIEYDNDTGASDESFTEWWDVTNGKLSYRSHSESDANYLLSILNQPIETKPGANSATNTTLED